MQGAYKKVEHLNVWDINPPYFRRVKPRPPPGSAKAQPTYTEPWIDYSASQDVPSDNGLYHLAFIPTESEFISQSNHMLTPTINY